MTTPKAGKTKADPLAKHKKAVEQKWAALEKPLGELDTAYRGIAGRPFASLSESEVKAVLATARKLVTAGDAHAKAKEALRNARSGGGTGT